MPGLLILRLDAPVYYANALTVRDRVMQLVEESGPSVRVLLVDAFAQSSLDITSSEMLAGLVRRLRARGIDVCFAELHAPVQEFAAKTGLLEQIGEDHVFVTVDAAVDQLADGPAGHVTTARGRSRGYGRCSLGARSATSDRPDPRPLAMRRRLPLGG